MSNGDFSDEDECTVSELNEPQLWESLVWPTAKRAAETGELTELARVLGLLNLSATNNAAFEHDGVVDYLLTTLLKALTVVPHPEPEGLRVLWRSVYLYLRGLRNRSRVPPRTDMRTLIPACADVIIRGPADADVARNACFVCFVAVQPGWERLQQAPRGIPEGLSDALITLGENFPDDLGAQAEAINLYAALHPRLTSLSPRAAAWVLGASTRLPAERRDAQTSYDMLFNLVANDLNSRICSGGDADAIVAWHQAAVAALDRGPPEQTGCVLWVIADSWQKLDDLELVRNTALRIFSFVQVILRDVIVEAAWNSMEFLIRFFMRRASRGQELETLEDQFWDEFHLFDDVISYCKAIEGPRAADHAGKIFALVMTISNLGQERIRRMLALGVAEVVLADLGRGVFHRDRGVVNALFDR